MLARVTAELDRFYQLLTDGVNARRSAAGLALITRTKVAELEREAAKRAVEARLQVGFDQTNDPALDEIKHPTAEERLARLGWSGSIGTAELATWNYLWSDPVRAAVDIRTSSGALFGLLNSTAHRTILLDPIWTHWGAGIHREFKPGDDVSNPLLERWYFIIWLSTAVPSTTPATFGETYGLPKRITFSGTVSAHRFNAEGMIIGTRSMVWGKPSGATAGRRAVIPTQPGVWLYIVDGYYAGWYVPEGVISAGTS